MVPEFLPGINIAHMNLYKGNPQAGNRIPQGITVMGQRSRIDDRPIEHILRLVDFIH